MATRHRINAIAKPGKNNDSPQADGARDPRNSWLEPLAQKNPAIARMLAEPPGTPIKLSKEQAAAIVQAGIGARPDLPSGSAYVRSVKKYWRSLVPGARRSS